MSKSMGATGEFPQGKLNADDEGQLQLGVAADKAKNVVVVQFGKPISWFAIDADGADQFAELIQKKANELRGIATVSGQN